MPARKGTSKGASKGAASKKSASKAKGGGGTSTAAAQPLYGVVIRNTIARGDTAEMKRISMAGHKHLKDVTSALAKLDAKLKK